MDSKRVKYPIGLYGVQPRAAGLSPFKILIQGLESALFRGSYPIEEVNDADFSPGAPRSIPMEFGE